LSEQDTTRATIEAVNASDVAIVWRNQSGSVRVRRGYMHLAPKGSPDIVGILRDGRFVGLEMKKPGEKPSSVQEEWRLRFLASGGVAACAYSVEEALCVLRGALKSGAA
jgi:hypothetical protein